VGYLKPVCGGFPTAMNPMRVSCGWGYPERVETNDKTSNEKGPEVSEAKGRYQTT